MEDKNTCGIVDDHSGHRHKSDCCCRTEKDDRAEASRSCGHDTHSHEHTDNFHKGGCCEHEHHHGHHHKEACCCEHEHHREDTCGCGNEEHIEHRHDGGGCSCSHDHGDHHCHDDSGCGCGHDHSHEDPRQMKRELVTLAAGAGLLILGILVPGIFGMVTHIAAFLLVAWDILAGAVKNIRRGDIFGESFLMTIAGIGAVCIGEIPEGIMVFLLYRLGEYLQTKAVSSSRKSISALLDVRPDRANLLENGEVREVEADSVRVGSTILVRPGEKIPLDGVVISGDSQLDTSALTGEAMPREVGRGRQVMAGCINLNGALEICVERPFGESTASRILEMVEHAAGKKAVSEKFITRFARKYTPCVVAAAAVVAVLPPLMGFMAWRESLYSALCFLAISCPCALVISVPLSFFAAIGGFNGYSQFSAVQNYNTMVQAYSEKVLSFATDGCATFRKSRHSTKGTLERSQALHRPYLF